MSTTYTATVVDYDEAGDNCDKDTNDCGNHGGPGRG